MTGRAQPLETLLGRLVNPWNVIQFWANVVFALALVVWTAATSLPLCYVLHRLGQLRVVNLDEQVNMTLAKFYFWANLCREGGGSVLLSPRASIQSLMRALLL